MKTFFVILGFGFFTCLSSSVFAQNVFAQEIDLTPKLYGPKNAQDTSQVMFCFTKDQLKEIARITTKGYFSGQTAQKQEKIISHQQANLYAKDQIIINQKEEKKILTSQITARDSTIAGQQDFIAFQKQQLNEQMKKTLKAEKKAKRTRTWAVVAAVVMFVLGTQL
ncbi:hypothetical protein [Xanthocytophaga flava]|uniref:hypothetical protein n=1 Tax=Xanthocytophaga flava TaxID=3048013 RepID=UPI0028D10F1C|nr:hypothetical protein [Xanthocytophaga flavus]MDJ1468157.1 hypothetical protein [Xanthocytophaga flavus]